MELGTGCSHSGHDQVHGAQGREDGLSGNQRATRRVLHPAAVRVLTFSRFHMPSADTYPGLLCAVQRARCWRCGVSVDRVRESVLGDTI